MDKNRLKAWENQLAREQSAWDTAKNQRERELARLEARLDTLGSKTADKESAFARVSEALDTLVTRHTELMERIEAGNDRLSELASEAAATKALMIDLEALVKERQAQIDVEIATYEANQRQELDERLEIVKQQQVEAEAARDGLVKELSDKRTDLAQVVIDRQEAQQSASDEAQAAREAIDALKLRQDAAEALVSELEASVAKLRHERDQAASEASKYRADHDRFIDYEKAAWKVLNAKDRELQDRQSELQQGEQLLENRRSFLPKL